MPTHTLTESETTALRITPHEHVTIRRESPEALEVAVTWGPGGGPPPPHLHPSQDELFELLAGELQVKLDGVEHVLGPGDTLAVPAGAVHQMWNASDEDTRAIWRVTPAGRTADWFRELDRLQREGRVGGNGMPGLPVMAALLREYDDVFQVAVGPRPVVGAMLKVLAVPGRRKLRS